VERERVWVPSSSLMVGIDGACEAGVGSVDVVAGVFWGVGAAARSSTRLFLMNCFSDMTTNRQKRDGEKVGAERQRERGRDGDEKVTSVSVGGRSTTERRAGSCSAARQ